MESRTDVEYNEIICERVKSRRMGIMMTLEELKAIVEIDVATLSRKENGILRWRAGELGVVADALGADIGWLFGHDE